MQSRWHINQACCRIDHLGTQACMARDLGNSFANQLEHSFDQLKTRKRGDREPTKFCAWILMLKLNGDWGYKINKVMKFFFTETKKCSYSN